MVGPLVNTGMGGGGGGGGATGVCCLGGEACLTGAGGGGGKSCMGSGVARWECGLLDLD